MLQVLSGVQLQDREANAVSWSAGLCSQFKVKSCYLMLHNLLSELDFNSDFVAAVQRV
jgi:hypothetical protein